MHDPGCPVETFGVGGHGTGKNDDGVERLPGGLGPDPLLEPGAVKIAEAERLPAQEGAGHPRAPPQNGVIGRNEPDPEFLAEHFGIRAGARVSKGADYHLVALAEMSDMMKHRDPVSAVGRIGNSLAEVEKSQFFENRHMKRASELAQTSIRMH